MANKLWNDKNHTKNYSVFSLLTANLRFSATFIELLCASTSPILSDRHGRKLHGSEPKLHPPYSSRRGAVLVPDPECPVNLSCYLISLNRVIPFWEHYFNVGQNKFR